ncbi:hypothetical protein KOR42_06840 [Thalassoglobus neptunius]|uniref:Thioredoxin domain-containing protein n=1 Tax=Thalassoglobus neptunius TaxID=1938619 RepID=A0A5C5X2H9_9PLAN|nr:DUF420 domain-containing protein [Thalassoglobus neptunius]TWT57324.1 hypothetical protein KOR42_06840 [Thalassoglobus neptunius]
MISPPKPESLVKAILFLVAFLGPCEALIGQESEETPAEIVIEPGTKIPLTYRDGKDGDYRVWNPEKVDDFTLVDQTGTPFTNEDLLGKPWIVNFVFTRCSYQCPLTCKTMMEFNKRISDIDCRIVTITVDPEHDDVDRMQIYSEIWGADPERWIFATGEPEVVWDLIRKGFKISAWENVGTDRVPGMEFAHDNNIIHVSADGEVLGRYDSVVADDMTTLKNVLEGEIETPEDHRPTAVEGDESVTIREYFEGDQAEPVNPLDKLPAWAKRLPGVIAMLNSLATVLLILGYIFIKSGYTSLHKKSMLFAFGVSVAFLACYLSYHFALHYYADSPGKPFEGTGTIRIVYFSILISHVILAALVPVLAIVTIIKGLRASWDSHRRWARVTFPIWLYVSVTGVIIYWMLYRL